MTANQDADRQRLHELGYAQELNRKMGWFSNFAISFSIISILAGAITTFWLAMYAGGGPVVWLCWIIVGLFATCVGASMAEICSAYPTAGGLYYWSAKLAKKNGPVWSWFTGWFNLIGQIGVIASVDFALANFVWLCMSFYIDDFRRTPLTIFVIYLVMLALHGLLNTFGVKVIKLLGDISVWWHVVGVAIIFASLFIWSSDSGQGASALTEFRNGTGWSFPGSGIYVFLIGLLLAQYTITGFDASAHVSEETVGAQTEAPKAIIRSIYVSAIAALIMNIAMFAVIPSGSYDDIAAQGILAGPAVFLTITSSAIGKFLVIISTVGQFFCGMASVTANSRMIYAFSRDKGLPGSDLWHRINPKTRTPTNSVWLGVGLSAIVGALSLIQTKADIPVAFFAMTGICVVGLYISYIIPVYLRLKNPDFRPGPWNLGDRSKTIGWISVAWVALVSIVFVCPFFVPWNKWETANLTGPVLLIAAVFVGGWWVLGAKKWFKGPQVQGTPEELEAIEHELSQLGH